MKVFEKKLKSLLEDAKEAVDAIESVGNGGSYCKVEDTIDILHDLQGYIASSIGMLEMQSSHD